MNKNFVIFVMMVMLSHFSFSQKVTTDSIFKVTNKLLESTDAAMKLKQIAAETEAYEPIPPTVKPGSTLHDAPSDAIILFDGSNFDAWMLDDSTKRIGWKIIDGAMLVNNESGGINTKQKFVDFQLHIEWKVPADVIGSGQHCGNSGVFLAYLGKENKVFEMGYEIQILESYSNKTYVNGQAGALYKQTIPLVNASKKPGEWQVFDIIWKAPRFNNDGSLNNPAFITVLHNGIAIHNNTELTGQTLHIGKPYYKMHGAAPIRLQAHGDSGPTVSFRNIWLRKL